MSRYTSSVRASEGETDKHEPRKSPAFYFFTSPCQQKFEEQEYKLDPRDKYACFWGKYKSLEIKGIVILPPPYSSMCLIWWAFDIVALNFVNEV